MLVKYWETFQGLNCSGREDTQMELEAARSIFALVSSCSGSIGTRLAYSVAEPRLLYGRRGSAVYVYVYIEKTLQCTRQRENFRCFTCVTSSCKVANSAIFGRDDGCRSLLSLGRTEYIMKF